MQKKWARPASGGGTGGGGNWVPESVRGGNASPPGTRTLRDSHVGERRSVRVGTVPFGGSPGGEASIDGRAARGRAGDPRRGVGLLTACTPLAGSASECVQTRLPELADPAPGVAWPRPRKVQARRCCSAEGSSPEGGEAAVSPALGASPMCTCPGAGEAICRQNDWVHFGHIGGKK